MTEKMTIQEETPIGNQAEINVLLNNLKNIVKTRLLGINGIIKKIRTSTPRELTNEPEYKDKINVYKAARKTTSIILNRISVLLDKGIFTVQEFDSLRTDFINLTIPNEKVKKEDDEFIEP